MTQPVSVESTRLRLREEVSAIKGEIVELSRNVHDSPEIAFEERRAAGWTAELLRRHGFAVTQPFGGLETAIEATWAGRGFGPVVALLGEYDALPEIGHGCGHNLMCSSSAGAAIAVARTLGRDFDGELRFVGTPAEEAGNGKVYLIEAGAFRDVSVALQMHPSDETRAVATAQALQEVLVAFHGRTAHAAADPWNGANALDAVIALFNFVSQWRQHLQPGEKIHGIITHGGAAPNIVPDETAAHFFVRSAVDQGIDRLVARLTTLAESAAAANGCAVDVRHDRLGRSRTMVNNAVLLDVFRRHLAAEGWVEADGERASSGSTDMGDVSHELPTIHPHMACGPKGTPGHSREFSALAGGPEGERTLLGAATTLGMTAVELLLEPSLVDAAWRGFEVSQTAPTVEGALG